MIDIWSAAPGWANFCVTNHDGSIYWFELEPTYEPKTGCWARGFYQESGRNEKFNTALYSTNSLVRRTDSKPKLSAMTAALETAIIALDDWTCITAPLFCEDKRVAEANARIAEGGTLWYIATVLEECRNAKDL